MTCSNSRSNYSKNEFNTMSITYCKTLSKLRFKLYLDLGTVRSSCILELYPNMKWDVIYKFEKDVSKCWQYLAWLHLKWYCTSAKTSHFTKFCFFFMWKANLMQLSRVSQGWLHS